MTDVINVSYATIELVYWSFGSAFMVYLILRLFATLIGNKW